MPRGLSKYLLIAILLAPAIIYAQGRAGGDTQFTARLDHTRLKVGESASLLVTLSGPDIDTRPSWNVPDLGPGLRVTGRMGPSSQTNLQIVNGQKSITKTVTMSYEIQALQAGTYTIPSFASSVKGQIIRTNPIQVQVEEPEQATTGEESDEWTPPSFPYLQARVDKKEVYVGEQVDVSWYLMFRQDPYNIQFTGMPSLNGFAVSDLDIAHDLMPTERGRGGNRYREGFMISKALFPIQAGTAVIDPLEVSYAAPRKGRGGFFDDMFPEQRSIRSEPVSINVLPLPAEGQPAEFSGAVGRFEIEARLERPELKENDSVNLTVSIAGSGNIDYLRDPQLPFPESFEIYPPEVEKSTQVKSGQMVGMKNFKYIIVPKKAGTYTLPAVRLSFFDPQANKYGTISSKPLTLNVLPGQKREEPPIATVGPAAREEVKVLAKDLRYIKPDAVQIKEQRYFWFRSRAIWALHLLPVAGLIAALGWRRRSDRLLADAGYARLRRALKESKKHLAQAQKLAKQNNPAAFYAELQRGLTQYFADRFNLAAAGLTCDIIEATAREKGLPEEQIKPLLDSLNNCDMARFGSMGHDQRSQELALEKARHAIQDLERSR